jgi:hypothetical protein
MQALTRLGSPANIAPKAAMAARGIRWVRLALYLLGGLLLATVAMVIAYGKGWLGGRKDEPGRKDETAQREPAPDLRPSAAVPPKPDALALRDASNTDPVSSPSKPAVGRGRRLEPNVRQPEEPPSWENWDDNYDMNLE